MSGARAGDKETEQLQAHELEKLLQHPAVMAMIQQMAGGSVPGAIASPEQLHMQQNQAVRFPQHVLLYIDSVSFSSFCGFLPRFQVLQQRLLCRQCSLLRNVNVPFAMSGESQHSSSSRG